MQQYVTEIEELKTSLKQEREKQKQLKFKSGQLFIKALSDARAASEAEAERRVKEAQLLASQKIAELQSQKAQVQAEKAQMQAQVLPSNAVGGMENLQDDDAILNLFKALKGNPPGMQERMARCDSDGDGQLS